MGEQAGGLAMVAGRALLRHGAWPGKGHIVEGSMAQTGILQDKLVTLFGGSGFVGAHVAQALLARGARVRIASRTPEKAWKLKPLANLGQLQFAPCDIRNEQAVRQACEGAHAVVNLVGAFGGDMKGLMGIAAGRIAHAARTVDAAALVHVSAIGADPESDSGYAQAKALGERCVREGFPGATVVRPSIVFGEGDNFINMFARLIRAFPVLPVFGPDAPIQPLHVDDLAEALARAVENPALHGGKTYELGGPTILTMLEMHRSIATAQRRGRALVPMPDTASAAFAMLPGSPMSTDQWLLLKQGNIASGSQPGFAALGIAPRPLDLFLDRWMERYRKHGRFTGRAGIA